MHNLEKTFVHRIATNATYLLVSQLLTWGLSLVVSIVLPRTFGAEVTGAYYLATAIWGIAALVIGFGTDVIISRQIARDAANMSQLVWAGVCLRVIFHFVVFVFVAVYVNVAGYSAETIQLTYIFGLANLAFQIGHMFNAALYGLEKFGWLSLVGFLTELITTIGILVLLFFGQSILVIALISIVAGSARTILLFTILRKRHLLQFTTRLALFLPLLREGATILGNRLVLTAYHTADVIVISWYVNETVVGWYGVADVAFGSLLFFPNIIGSTLFPTLARLHREDIPMLITVSRRTLERILLTSIPLGLGTVAMATPLVILIVGEEFAPAGTVLSIFGIVMIFTGVNIFFAQLLIATEHQNQLTLIMTIALIITIPIDLALIPWTQSQWGNGALGGVIAYLITESLITIGSLRILPRNMIDRHTQAYALKALFSGLIMLAVVWPIRRIFVLWPILVGGFVYCIMAFMLKLITRDDLYMIVNVMRDLRMRIKGVMGKGNQ